jgi:hypothetical protein
MNNRSVRCLLCDEDKLREVCDTPKGRHLVASMLSKMNPTVRTLALDHRLPPVFAQDIRTSGLEQYGVSVVAPLPVRKRGRKVVETPYTDEEISSRRTAEKNIWRKEYQSQDGVSTRHMIRSEPSEKECKFYRKKLVEDRARAQYSVKLPTNKRLTRNAEVDNEFGLPPAKRSRRATDLEHWCLFNSWCKCRECGLLQPRSMTPDNFDGPVDPCIDRKDCAFCTSKQSYDDVPKATTDVPEELRLLTPATLAALSPLEIDLGPQVYAKDHYGNEIGYRQHTSMIRFSWCQYSVKQRIEQLPTADEKQAGRRAHHWLLEAEDSSYWEIHRDHVKFLEKKPNADARERKRWLRTLERVGLECALWPHMFWKTSMCLTYVRSMNTWRVAKRSTETWGHVLDGDRGCQDDYLEEANHHMSSVKRWWQALVMSPLLDYISSGELLQFTWDLTMWSALGAKKNVGTGEGTPKRLGIFFLDSFTLHFYFDKCMLKFIHFYVRFSLLYLSLVYI